MPTCNQTAADLNPDIHDLAIDAISKYYDELRDRPNLARSHLAGMGAIAELEAKIARHYGKKYALCLNNATTALMAIALALDLQGETFITTGYSYGGTVAGWLMLGNRPVFADIDPHNLTLDPEAVRRAITRSTKAILSVDTFGNPADMEALRSIADEFDLWLISDAAQSLGAERNGQPASSLADAIVISMTAGKTLFAGEGGAIVTDDAALYQKLIYLTQHPDRQRRDISLLIGNQLGLNGRMHPLAAVVANATFERSLSNLQEHQQFWLAIADVLNQSGLTVPILFRDRNILPAFFCFSAVWREQPKLQDLFGILSESGFNLSIGAPPIQPIYQQAAFVAKYAEFVPIDRLPNVELANDRFVLRSLS